MFIVARRNGLCYGRVSDWLADGYHVEFKASLVVIYTFSWKYRRAVAYKSVINPVLKD
jgi:hypothetical protein